MRATLRIIEQKGKAKLADEHICGTGKKGTFVYSVEVEHNRLDSDQFVMDNRIFKDIETRWNDRVYMASCEQLAGGIVKLVFNKFLEKTRQYPKRITATIINTTGNVSVQYDSVDYSVSDISEIPEPVAVNEPAQTLAAAAKKTVAKPVTRRTSTYVPNRC